MGWVAALASHASRLALDGMSHDRVPWSIGIDIFVAVGAKAVTVLGREDRCGAPVGAMASGARHLAVESLTNRGRKAPPVAAQAEVWHAAPKQCGRGAAVGTMADGALPHGYRPMSETIPPHDLCYDVGVTAATGRRLCLAQGESCGA